MAEKYIAFSANHDKKQVGFIKNSNILTRETTKRR